MKNLAALILSFGFVYPLFAQQYEHGFKKPRDYQLSKKNWYHQIENDVYSSKQYLFLDDLNGNYFKRYDYLSKSESNVKVHPSTCLKDQISGMSMNGEYVDFYPEVCADSIIPAVYLSKRFVSNEDWNQFQNYVMDSTVRSILMDEMPEGFGTPTMYFPYDDSEPDFYAKNMSSEWNINWDKKIDYKIDPSNELMKYFYDRYYPEHERIDRKPEIDPRKLMFSYYWLHNTSDKGVVQYDRRPFKVHVDSFFNYDKISRKYADIVYDSLIRDMISTISDSTLWKLQSTAPHYGDMGDQLVYYYAWHPQFKDYPVTSINGYQAKGYLAWKQREHQQYLDRKDLPYIVEYSLPTPYEIKENDMHADVVVNDFDMSEYRITNQDYLEFIDYVRDSIGLRILSEELEYEKYMKPTFNGEGERKAPEEWILNWSRQKDVHSKDTKIRSVLEQMEYPEFLGGKTFDWDPRKLSYAYSYYNFKLAAPLGELKEARHGYETGYETCPYFKPLEIPYNKAAKRYEELGKDLSLGYVNSLCRNNSVRSHMDRSRFIIYERISIYPEMQCVSNYFCKEYDWEEKGRADCCTEFFEGKRAPEYDFTSEPKASMTNINYEQAHAYYCWKQKKDGYIVKHDDVLIANYIPSEEEWKRIQKGQKVVHPGKTYQMPTPVFRYTMKFYPRHK